MLDSKDSKYSITVVTEVEAGTVTAFTLATFDTLLICPVT